MTFARPAFALAALAAWLLVPAAARAQLPTIDVANIANTAEIITKAQDQIDRIEQVRDRIDQQVLAATDPWADLAAEATALRTSAITLPGALGTPPAVGGRLRARLEGTRTPLPGEPANADLVTPPQATPAQVRAGITPTATGDPLAGTAATRLARERQLRERARQRLAAAVQREREQAATAATLAGTGMTVWDSAAGAFAVHDASPDTSWTALHERNVALTQTLAVVESQALALRIAELERATLQRQDALTHAARGRLAAYQAAAVSKQRHAAYQASATRDAGDDLIEECGGRFFSGGCETVPAGF